MRRCRPHSHQWPDYRVLYIDRCSHEAHDPSEMMKLSWQINLLEYMFAQQQIKRLLIPFACKLHRFGYQIVQQVNTITILSRGWLNVSYITISMFIFTLSTYQCKLLHPLLHIILQRWLGKKKTMIHFQFKSFCFQNDCNNNVNSSSPPFLNG